MAEFQKALPIFTFEQYSEMFKDLFVMRRKNGIIEVRAHTNGEAPIWSMAMHRGIGQMLRCVGADPENEVLIFTSTGEHWFKTSLAAVQQGMKELDADAASAVELKMEKAYARSTYDMQYADGRQLHEGFLNDIHIPTIAAINGPGGHTSFGLFCDITICTEDSVFQDLHFSQGMPGGEGQYLAMQTLMGLKRANYCSLMGEYVDAQTALELGMVNEIIPRDKLLDRAWEIAERIMNRPRMTRRMMSEIMRRKWKDVFHEDYTMQYFAQCWANAVEGMPKFHDPERLNHFNTVYEEENRFQIRGKDEYKPNFSHELV